MFCYLLAAYVLTAFAKLDIKIDPAIRYRYALPASPKVALYETFPPIDDIVVQNFHFKTSSALILDLQDAFCTGHRYEVYDNFQLIGSGEDILNFCGISADNLKPIGNPHFLNVKFLLDAGEHQLAVVIFHSPIGGKKTSMRITLIPIGNDQCQVSVLAMEEKSFPKPSSAWSPADFVLTDYLQKKTKALGAAGHLLTPSDDEY